MVNNTKRLVILCFYEENGYVDLYVYYLVKELLSISKKMVIVVNGKIEDSAERYFTSMNCDILIRENKGYDAAAYKDVIGRLGKEKLKMFDEVVLCNDTFFGPFIPIKEIFEIMSINKCDFWGISYQDTNLVQFIESYFLVFRREIIKSDDLWLYFQYQKEIVKYQDALIYFELGVFLYLKNKGYIYDSLITKKIYYSNILYPYESVKFEKLPILKKRAFIRNADGNLIRAINYIRYTYKYDVGLIELWMKRKKVVLNRSKRLIEETLPERAKDIPCVNLSNIYSFCKKWKRICIYGDGYYGRILFEHYQIRPECIIITEKKIFEQAQYCGIPVRIASEIDMNDTNLGIIVALNKQHTEEIKKKIGKGKNILYIW